MTLTVYPQLNAFLYWFSYIFLFGLIAMIITICLKGNDWLNYDKKPKLKKGHI
jgi:hypothetical protein